MAHNAFDDAAAYERFMGRWSRAVGGIFVEWIRPPNGAHWLDIGCGTGAFTELVLDRCSPAAVVAVDPSAAQIDHARNNPVGQRADFRVADAEMLPFADDSFDVVASALVINFIPDRPRAIAEMRRVARPGGLVAGYVWDFAEEGSPSSLIRAGLRQIGANPPRTSGTEDSRLTGLSLLFRAGGLNDIATRTVDVTMSFLDFEEFWRTQTPAYSPTGKLIAGLSKIDHVRLIEAVQAILPRDADGGIGCSARANAIKARVPG